MGVQDILRLLNENQGVLAAIPIIGGIVFWFLKRKRSSSVHIKSPYVSAGKNISAGGDIIVGGQKTQVINGSEPIIAIKGDGFTYTRGRLDLIFENTGNSTAVIYDLKIGGDQASIEEFSLGPQQKATKQFNIAGFKVLTQKIDNPKLELKYKDFSTGKKYRTTGVITQEPRADGNFNFGRIKEVAFSSVNTNTNSRSASSSPISKLESRVLKKLYNDYKKTGVRTKWKATDAYKGLGIKDGTYVGLLNDSKFISISLDNTHECFMITNDGIRYMEDKQ